MHRVRSTNRPVKKEYSGTVHEITDHAHQALRGLRMAVVDESFLHRTILTTMLKANGAAAVGDAGDLISLRRVCEDVRPHIVLLKIGTRAAPVLLREATAFDSRVKVIVFGVPDDDETQIVECVEMGVAGYHTRREDLADLLTLIGRVAAGKISFSPTFTAALLNRLAVLAAQREAATRELFLTDREAQILQMLELGLSNHEIAMRLSIAVHTVKNHVHSLLKKLGVTSRADAAALARASRRCDG